jgi:hypothetical protein
MCCSAWLPLIHVVRLTLFLYEHRATLKQIKPLTEEEKKAKLAELRQKLAEKRAAQSQDDAKAQRANEVSLISFRIKYASS